MERDKVSKLTLDLINTVRVTFEVEIARHTAPALPLKRLLTALPELKPNPEPPEARQLPVCRHLARALDLGEAGPAAPVAIAIRELEATLTWVQNPRYNVDNRGADFMDNYAYSDLNLIGSTSFYLGIMLLGPGITYPVTSYPSEGAFLVISGSPEWKSGDGPWRRVKDGSIICRPVNGAEGKRPGKEPMLALYAWLYP